MFRGNPGTEVPAALWTGAFAVREWPTSVLFVVEIRQTDSGEDEEVITRIHPIFLEVFFIFRVRVRGGPPCTSL